MDKNKRNKHIKTEFHSNYSLNKSKHKLNLSKHLSNSKNKNEKIYINNEEKVDNDIKKGEIPKNLEPINYKKYRRNNNRKLREIQKYFNDLGINDTYKLYIPQLDIHNSNKNSINNDLKIRNTKNIEKMNTKQVANRYIQNLPNLYQYKIRKNNSNSLNHYDAQKYDIIPKPIPNRKMNLLLNKKFGIKLI